MFGIFENLWFSSNSIDYSITAIIVAFFIIQVVNIFKALPHKLLINHIPKKMLRDCYNGAVFTCLLTAMIYMVTTILGVFCGLKWLTLSSVVLCLITFIGILVFIVLAIRATE